MALPTNGPSGGIPRKPQQGLPVSRQPREQESESKKQQPKNPAAGLPSIPQSRPRPQQRPAPIQQSQGGLPTPDRVRQAPPQQRQHQRPATPSPRRAAPPAGSVQNPYDGDENPFEELTLDDVLAEDDEFLSKAAPEPVHEEPEEDPVPNVPAEDIEQAKQNENPQPVQTQDVLGEYYETVAKEQDHRAAEQEAREEGRDADYEAAEQVEGYTAPGKPFISEAEKDTKDQNLYVDEERKKLRTFGGSKRKIKVDEYDLRKNKEKRAKIIQYSALGLFGAFFITNLVALPYVLNNTVTPSELQQVVKAETGGTGFPLNSGEGFAVNFMEAYLTYTGNETIDAQALQYYQTGTMSASGGDLGASGRTMSGDVRQRVVTGPTVFGVHDIAPYSAAYTIGALVETTSTEEGVDDSSVRWEFFQVNVHFDADTGTFYIPPETPTMIPEYNVGARSDVPRADELGTGTADDVLTEEVQSVVLGFLRAWAESSPDSTVAIDQYIVPGEGGEHLQDGFDNEYVFANGDAESSVTFQAYPNEIDGNVKVDVTVNWAVTVADADGEDRNAVEYTSTYVMTLEEQGDGRYLVSNFAPKVYTSVEAQ